MSSVSRETLDQLADQHGLRPSAAGQFLCLLEALGAETDPHTAVSDPAHALDIHIRDSLVALEVAMVREARTLVDIGAGPGFPGLPLAVALREAQIDLVESASRKTAVIERLAAAAGIPNARPVRARAEEWAASEGAGRYDVATARAVAPLAVLVEYAAPLLRVGGTFVAWKGSPAAEEVHAGAAAARQLGLDPLDPVPVTPYEGARDLHLYLYSKVRETPPNFPRRPGMAAKRPLGAKNGEGAPLT